MTGALPATAGNVIGLPMLDFLILRGEGRSDWALGVRLAIAVPGVDVVCPCSLSDGSSSVFDDAGVPRESESEVRGGGE